MSPELITSLVSIGVTTGVAFIGWSLRSTLQGVREQIKAVGAQIDRVEVDVRQLAAAGARHGESLAAGVQEFKDIDRRLGRLENMVFGAGPAFGGGPTQSSVGIWPTVPRGGG